MKILIGTAEIANWVFQIKEELEKQGHKVTTMLTERNSFYDNHYDIVLNEKFTNKALTNANSRFIFHKLARKISSIIYNLKVKKFVYGIIDQNDVIIKLWHPYLKNSNENSYIKKKGKKLVQLFVGSDARYFEAFKQEFDISEWNFPKGFTDTDISTHLNFIRNAEKYADSIYSLPDQAGLQLRPYYHLQVPVDQKKIKFINHNRKIPKVLHAPSSPHKKGTDLIESTLKQLKEEGVQFQFCSIRNLPHQEVLDLLSDSDVLIDELIAHGPGALSLEAMFSGCVVATRFLEDSPNCFRPPVFAINAKNISSRLKDLLTNADLRGKLIEEGRNYAFKNNTTEKVVQIILQDLSTQRPYDYFPRFLRYNYTPLDKNEIKIVNYWNRYVQHCQWYRKNIQKGHRNKLAF